MDRSLFLYIYINYTLFFAVIHYPTLLLPLYYYYPYY